MEQISFDIMSELIGKRTLMIYLSLREDILHNELKNITKYPEKHREYIKRKTKGRLREIKSLKNLINQGHTSIKKKSIRYWRSINKSV